MTSMTQAIAQLPPAPTRADWKALLFAAARSDHVAKAIKPALVAGKWVVCDRFILSSRAYQGLAGGMGDNEVQTLHRIGSGGLEPCLTLLLAAPSDDVAERLRLRDGEEADAIGGRQGRYHADVARGFAGLAQGNENIAQIDASGTAEEVHKAIMAKVEPLLGETE